MNVIAPHQPHIHQDNLEAALRTLLDAGTFGCNATFDEIADGTQHENAIDGTAKACLSISMTGVDRDLTCFGIEEVFFNEDSSNNDNGWCEGRLVALLQVDEGYVVIDASRGSPEYCDDECNGWLSGRAYLFEHQVVGSDFAAMQARGVKEDLCCETFDRLLRQCSGTDPVVIARRSAESQPNIEADSWLRAFAQQILANPMPASDPAGRDARLGSPT